MRYVKYVVMAALIASMLSVTTNTAFSQLGRMIVEVDKTNYTTGETIEISGRVPVILEGVPVSIQVFNPRNVLYSIDQVEVNADRTFSTDVTVGGKLGISGTYTVRATYLGNFVTTSFELVAEKPVLRVDGFEIEATLSNGVINSIEVDQEFKSVIISVTTRVGPDGELVITLPREVIDSRINGDDDDFIVLVNGVEVEYEETRTTANERELTIPVMAGTEEIEILGTSVIPEFGILAFLVLVLAVSGIIAVTRKNSILKAF